MKKGGDDGAEEKGDDGAGDAAGEFARPENDEGERSGGENGVGPIDGAGVFGEHFHFFGEFGGNIIDGEAEEIFDLRAEDDDRDAAGETGGDGIGDELDHRAEARETHDEEHDAGHSGADDEILNAVLRDGGVNDANESAGGSADLHAGTAERRDEKTGDDGGPETGLRFDAGGDAEGHGERKGDDADGESGGEVGGEVRAGVSFERGEKSRVERKSRARFFRHGRAFSNILISLCLYQKGRDRQTRGLASEEQESADKGEIRAGGRKLLGC